LNHYRKARKLGMPQVARILELQEVENEISDSPSLAHEVLEQVEARSAIVVQCDDLSIHGCIIRQFGQGIGDIGELLIE
jgi:hypothetical protein